MTAKTMFAMALVVLGTVVLAYSGVAFTTPGPTVDLLGLRIQTVDNHFIPPVVGLMAVIAGVLLLVINPKRLAKAGP